MRRVQICEGIKEFVVPHIGREQGDVACCRMGKPEFLRAGEMIVGKNASISLLSKMTGELAWCFLIEGQER